jgi:hypothetical protein
MINRQLLIPLAVMIPQAAGSNLAGRSSQLKGLQISVCGPFFFSTLSCPHSIPAFEFSSG